MEAHTLRLSEAQFRKPFAEFWSDYFRKNPEVACVRCLIPPGWSPRNGRPYNLRNVTIDTPIKQHVSERAAGACCWMFPRVWGLLTASSPAGLAARRKVRLLRLCPGGAACECPLPPLLMMHPPLLPSAQP